MRKLVVLAGLVGLASSSAYGGSAFIDFSSVADVGAVGGFAPAGSTRTFDVTLDGTGSSIPLVTAIQVIFRSDDLAISLPSPGAIGLMDVAPATGLGSSFLPDGSIGFFGSGTGFLSRFGQADINFVGVDAADVGRALNFQALLLETSPGSAVDALGHMAYNFGNDGSVTPIGQLTVDASGLPVGDYTVELSSFSALGGFNVADETLVGTGTLSVVPEPATLALLGIGGIAALRRRKKA